MAIDAKHRSSIFNKLLPILGDEDANILMSEFPSIEADELVTKQFLRAELSLSREGLRQEMAELSAELRSEMAELRAELRGEMAELRTEMGRLETRLTVRLGGAVGASTTLVLAAVTLVG